MKIRTLIVEDDPMISSINKGYLDKLDSYFDVDYAANGNEALDKVKLKRFDLLLLDLYMPKMNGLEFLRKIRKESEKLDVIMITAADSPGIIEEALRLGVVDYILKPFDFKRFEQALLHYERRFSLFKSEKSIDQSAIDQLQIKDKNEVMELPKGIDSVTLTIIRDKLKTSQEPLTIHKLADEVDISKITIRKYLEYLSKNNEIELSLNYSTRGRPSKLYSYLR